MPDDKNNEKEDESVDDDDDEDDDRPDFDFINSRREKQNYLNLTTATLAGLLYNEQQEEADEAAEINASEPWEHIKTTRKDFANDKIKNTVCRSLAAQCLPPILTWCVLYPQESNIQAINLAQTVTKTLQNMESDESKIMAAELIEKALYYYIKGPKKMAKIQRTKELIQVAHERVSYQEAEHEAEKRKQKKRESLKDMLANPSVESSSVARKRRRRE